VASPSEPERARRSRTRDGLWIVEKAALALNGPDVFQMVAMVAEFDRVSTATHRPQLDFATLHRRLAMVEMITVETIDGELGVVFTRPLAERLQIAEGDTFLVSVEDGGLLLTRSVPSPNPLPSEDDLAGDE
jgi:hypothetical protein